ncbi:NADH dehydrogenase subunit 4 (mitochondrion) [Neurospora crassa OR74A]|uniref:NADH-ubiquinone oxidoreductase chain 4 n=4 Tax=cellular organisms TaxID=131567 RepID=NU4M_NEUCR|nr:NADH dehydrogenase subunit 4 [Neurospora crassa OR74A]P0CY44.1 RecName: Full=NADH-ubiquinone oxidoreductase chain 4; AltName: Full=NADH dehydrogenase subunit 4 [Neurospora crassa OR74A]AGG16009.1 NADH dehydrogenase subunit 4 [Neurospora crassa OR74A]QUB01641.1 NADH dehydrogenase subunit 4 [Neurospora crassa]|eukprot:YP_009126721.1 NADH dehydrogenase subunit 4 (mitochondrion) [Neurospora crassa OR74A]
MKKEFLMFLFALLIIPIIGIFIIWSTQFYSKMYQYPFYYMPYPFKKVVITEGANSCMLKDGSWSQVVLTDSDDMFIQNETAPKVVAFIISILNLMVSLLVYILFDFSNNQFQFIQEHYDLSFYDIYLGVDGISIYFVLLTTIIIPIALMSNWNSITNNVKSYLIIMLLLETLLLAVFLVLDILLFYIFFESILPPLFILIGLFGSSNKVRASFYIFLYTLLGSLFLLLSILTMSSIMGTTYFDALLKSNFDYTIQIFLFCGIFIAFAVKTPTIFLNNWLLKAHVESPLGGSIVLAGIVLKLSLYGIFRLILPLLPKASLNYTYIIFVIGVITIIYASFSTLRTTDIKELIAYSSVSHAAVYLIGVFSNTIQGIEGGILLGLAHGFTSPALFFIVGGVLYDRSGTRLIHYYKGIAQMAPLLSLLFFIFSLANCGVPLTLNFVGEFMSLYGVFERLPLLGLLASSSIVFSAAYSIFLFNRVAFGGSFSKFFENSIIDLTKREFYALIFLGVLVVFLGIYPSIILDGLHYNVSSLIYSYGCKFCLG